jgi:hypothetical protein
MNEELTTALTERLRDASNGDPLTAMLVEQIVASAATQGDTVEEDAIATSLARAERLLERAQQDLVAANTMAEWVAGAVGACQRCWGLDRFCRTCSGAGVPGSRPPDLEEFVAWIEPAFRRAGLVIVDATARNGVGINDLEGASDVRT